MNMERRGSVRPPEGRAQLNTQEEVRRQAKPFDIDKRLFVEAYRRVKANAGAAGVDRVSLQAFEENLKDNLYKLWNRMSSGSYMPPPVRAVAIPKKSGGERTLGIPTVADRVAQMVVKLQVEPEVEPHFYPDSYGYRPSRSALDAIEVTRERCWRHNWVLEFDIKGLFDNIPHDLLMRAVDKHCPEKWTRLYIRRWLSASLVKADGEVQQRSRGTPQGGVISPLLANLFLHYAFDRWLSEQFPAVPWCRYADDGLLHCTTCKQAHFMWHRLRERLEQCGLDLHPEKSQIVYCKDDRRQESVNAPTQFDFLGYTFRARAVRSRDGGLFRGFCPAASKAALKAIRQRIKRWWIGRKTGHSLEAIAAFVNPYLHGWWNYYGRFYPSTLYCISRYINQRLVRWAMRKYRHLKGKKKRTVALFERLVRRLPRLFAHWAKGMSGAFA